MSQYHSTASVLAIATAWNSRSTVIIGRKFSATHFWRDVRATNANVIQYVGEGRQAAILLQFRFLLARTRLIIDYAEFSTCSPSVPARGAAFAG